MPLDLDLVRQQFPSLDLDDFARALEQKSKIAAFDYASNLLETVNLVKKLT